MNNFWWNIIFLVIFGALLLFCTGCNSTKINYDGRCPPEDAVYEVWVSGSWYFTMEKPVMNGTCVEFEDVDYGYRMMCGRKVHVAPRGQQWGMCERNG